MDNKIIPAVVIVALLLVGGIMLFSGNEPEPAPEPEPVTTIIISSVDVTEQSAKVTVSIDGDYDHWHVSIDKPLNEMGMAGGIMVGNGLSHTFNDIEPGEHTIYAGAVSANHNIVGIQVSETFNVESTEQEPEVQQTPPDIFEKGYVNIHIYDFIFGYEICEKLGPYAPETCYVMEYAEDEIPTIIIRVGTTVKWIQDDGLGAGGDAAYHNVVERNGEFRSPELTFEGTYTLKFDEVGEYEYFCEPHLFMVGRIIVVPEDYVIADSSE